MIPRKRKQQRKPIIVQRTLLPKMTTGPVMTILPTTDALVHSLSPQTVIMTHAPIVSSSASLNQQPCEYLNRTCKYQHETLSSSFLFCFDSLYERVLMLIVT